MGAQWFAGAAHGQSEHYWCNDVYYIYIYIIKTKSPFNSLVWVLLKLTLICGWIKNKHHRGEVVKPGMMEMEPEIKMEIQKECSPQLVVPMLKIQDCVWKYEPNLVRVSQIWLVKLDCGQVSLQTIQLSVQWIVPKFPIQLYEHLAHQPKRC